MRERLSVRLPAGLIKQLDDLADRKRISRAIVVETAVASYLSPDGADQLEAALARRLDRMSRELERLQRHSAITNETLALFVRFWLTHTPPLPDTAQAAAQSKGRERYEGFVEALGRRLARGKSLLDEITADAPQQAGDAKG
jgi:predicted transcriptional regulator